MDDRTVTVRTNRLSRSDRTFLTINNAFWVVVLFAVLYPLYLIIIASLSDPSALYSGQVIFWPVNPSLVGYSAIFQYHALFVSYLNSIIYTVTGTAISVIVTLAGAYTLSRRSFPGKKILMMFFVFIMFFNGGLIPTFITLKNLGFYNTRAILILIGCVSVWNLMVARSFIETSIPHELYESAVIDGADHFTYFFRIVMPLSTTIIAVLVVYYGVGKWNDYFTGLVYISDSKLLPLQTTLRQILATIQSAVSSDFAGAIVAVTPNADAVKVANVGKYCMIVISTGPIILLYLFTQKYFLKGVMIGSLKG